MDLSTLIRRASPFPILGVLVDNFHVFLNFDRSLFEKTVKILIRHSIMLTQHYAVSDLGPHCLPMSHKKVARLIWVKIESSCR